MMKKVTLIFAFVAFLSYVGISQTLTWRFANYEVVNAGTQLQFDVEVMASAATTYHRDLQVYFDYNTAGFGTNWAAGHVTVTPLSLMDNFYSVVNTADNTSSKIAIITEADNEMAQQGNASYFNLMPGTFTGLFQVTMDITDNTATAGIAFDETLMNGGQYYQSTSAIEPVKYADPCFYNNDLSGNKLSTLYGTITVANGVSTPLASCTVNGGAIGTASTDVNGFYNFSGIDNGAYTLTTTCSIPWQNETTVSDVNLVVDHILGTALTGVQYLAADVTWDGSVNVNDYNMMVDVILGASGYPAAPDWVFENQNVNVSGGIGTSSYQGLLSGDPDGSY
jgi:hypothetical protein